MGKSETAVELIKRGHRLVTDDVVELRKVSDDTLIGSAPDITKHFIELRGIGIIDVKTLFGVACVRETQSIDMVIRLEEWSKDKEYDRLGLEETYTEYYYSCMEEIGLPVWYDESNNRQGMEAHNLRESCEALAWLIRSRDDDTAHELADRFLTVLESLMPNGCGYIQSAAISVCHKKSKWGIAEVGITECSKICVFRIIQNSEFQRRFFESSDRCFPATGGPGGHICFSGFHRKGEVLYIFDFSGSGLTGRATHQNCIKTKNNSHK